MVNEPIRITLKSARVNAGYTLETASKALNVTKNTLSNWELGKTEPKTSQALQMSELYKMPYDNIIFAPTNSN